MTDAAMGSWRGGGGRGEGGKLQGVDMYKINSPVGEDEGIFPASGGKKQRVAAPHYTPGLGEGFWLRRGQTRGAAQLHTQGHQRAQSGPTCTLSLALTAATCYLFLLARSCPQFWAMAAQDAEQVSLRNPSDDRRELGMGRHTSLRDESPVTPARLHPFQPIFFHLPFPNPPSPALFQASSFTW